MVKSYNSDLCVGGPFDGKRYASPHPEGFKVAVAPKLAITAVPQEDLDQLAMKITEVWYRRIAWHTSEDQIVTHWAPEIENHFSVLIRLLNRYENRADFIARARSFLYNINSLFFTGTLIGRDTANYANDLHIFLTDLIEALEKPDERKQKP